MSAALFVTALAWPASGWLAVTIGTPLWMKRQDPGGYQFIRLFGGTLAGPVLLIAWACNLDDMRTAKWRP